MLFACTYTFFLQVNSKHTSPPGGNFYFAFGHCHVIWMYFSNTRKAKKRNSEPTKISTTGKFPYIPTLFAFNQSRPDTIYLGNTVATSCQVEKLKRSKTEGKWARRSWQKRHCGSSRTAGSLGVRWKQTGAPRLCHFLSPGALHR